MIAHLLRRPIRFLLALAVLATALLLFRHSASPVQSADDSRPTVRLTLRPGDHVCIIGNTLADRMQHDGWLETYLHSRFPTYDLTIRNLGFSGDEVAGFTDRPDANYRLRSQSFGTADQWLAGSAPVPEPGRLVTRHGVRDNRFATTNTKADVVLAFFGYNESFAGAAGLDKFKAELVSFIKHTLAQKYNGKSAPRLALFSPIAHENLRSPHLPDGSANNKRLELYTKAMADVARANGVAFVDLFHTTRDLYKKADGPLTINGVHLNEKGNEAVAKIIDRSLFGQRKETDDAKALEKLRRAVKDKCFYWFNRYRVMDGYNVYGGRAFEKYQNKQSNYEDQQRELEILDVMTANRDKRVWAVARGGDLKVDDSNVPPYIPVETNLRVNGQPRQIVFLDGEEAIKKMTIAKNMKVTLFASEKEFPELAKPVQMQFDPQGRLWVAVWPSYPHWKPGEKMDDKILIFEDTKGTGKADKVTVFADHLNCPTGFEFFNGGVLVAQAPDLIFLKDTKGTGKADLRVRVIGGLDSADSHHTANSFALDPGGALYFQEGTFHHTQVESPWGPPTRCVNAGVYRYEPRTQKFSAYVTYGFANPHGHVWNRWGQDVVYDGTGANPYHGALFSGHLDYPQKHRQPPQVYQQRTRPCPGVEILSSRLFPKENQGNLLVANVIGFQGILQYRVADQGASFAGTEVEPILSSTDPNFRPSDLKIGPDGAIWFIDWHNPIIGHLQHAIRDPLRDRTHGRIYRVTYEGRQPPSPVPIAGQPIDKLLDVLKQPEDRVRYRARIELGGRKTGEVMAELKKWVAGLDPKDADYEHQMMEALWLHQAHDVVDVDLLKRMLSSKEFRARAAATRVLCYWRDRVPDALGLLLKQAADDAPRVRLEAVRAASFLTVPEAVEIVAVTASKPTDRYLDYLRGETMRQLTPIVAKAIAAGHKLKMKTPEGMRYVLRSVSTPDLMKMERNQGVYLELLFRPNVRDEYRKEALGSLAKLEKKPDVQVLLDAIAHHDAEESAQDDSVAFDLVRLLTASRPAGELAKVRDELVKLATTAHQPVTRQLGFVVLIAADGSIDRAWTLATKSLRSLLDLVHAVPMIGDPGQRTALYPKVQALLTGLPKGLDGGEQSKTLPGRYVRIELPGRQRTLTLAEVEVFSNGVNIARKGKASQKNTAYGGNAGKAIDGNTNGDYSNGGQTHTREATPNPWWEVDLLSEQPIDSIVVWNRTDGNLGSRLQGFTLKVLDQGRSVVFHKERNPAPPVKTVFEVGRTSPAESIQRAAIAALPSVRGQEAETVKALAKFVKNTPERHAAVQALQRIPARLWPADMAKPVLDNLLELVRKVPVAERTAPAVVDSLQLADTLAGLLPPEEARKVRKELGDLGVRVIRVGTVLEQMIYDKERLVMQAGKPVEIVFENTDTMPHNLVFLQPGALEEIGELAEKTALEPSAMDRHYVPVSGKILLASHLVQPRSMQRLGFTAPKKPGVYPYVCTYPGHWRRMHGALYVVADLDRYQENPEGYLAKNSLPIADELLKFNRPRKEWKFEDLESSTKTLSGRSFASGKQMFTIASCVSCHKFGGQGQEFGPDLTKLDPKWTTADVLKHILEPSLKIDDKYRTYTFTLSSGKQVTGMILEETKTVVKLIENPLAAAKPIELKVADIESRTRSETSIMPKGLLDKLTREEILDLLAYVVSGANPKHTVYQGGHDHGHH